jgi:hypothetical protein
MPSFAPSDHIAARLAATRFLVEATSFEQLTLWRDHASQSPRKRDNAVQWEQLNDGVLQHVGFIAERPICLSLLWARLNGHLVLFHHATSSAVDYEVINTWLERYCPAPKHDGRKPSCDAQNFHLCKFAVASMSTTAAATPLAG